MYTLKQLRKIIKKIKKKDGLFEQNLILLTECKLSAFIYRASFLPNMFESIIYVKNGNIAVNKLFRFYPTFLIKPMDIITFRV